MYTLVFYFSDEGEEFENIKRVEYVGAEGEVSVSGDDIFLHKFPLNSDYHLFSEKTHHVVSGEGLTRIDIEKD